MAQFKFIDPAWVGLQAWSDSATVQNLPMGILATAQDLTGGFGVFQYVRGHTVSTAAAQGEIVRFVPGVTGTYLATATTGSISSLPWTASSGDPYQVCQAGTAHTGSKFNVGLAGAALSNTNVYGWVQVAGVADYARVSNTTTAAGNDLFLGSTLGRMHNTAGATGYRLSNISVVCWGTDTANTGSVTVALNFPSFPGTPYNTT